MLKIRHYGPVLAVVALAAFALAHRHSTPDLTGQWKSWRSDFRIASRDDGLDIEIHNPDGFLGGAYAGHLKRDVVTLTGPLSPLCGEMTYVRDADKLEFCGEEFQRVRR
jgi:hypothetical protein